MAERPAARKLTTILAADVVGYSQLMAADEEGTLATLRAFRGVTDGLVAKHGGRVFNTAGDAFLAELGSAVEAVRCAISLQEDRAVRNGELPPDRQMWFRIGINVGDVMIDDGDLFGDGVNVAARLEGLADRGGICISGSTFHQVKNKLSVAFDDMGAQTVKNIPEPIPAFRIVPGEVALNTAGRAAGATAGRSGALRAAAAVAALTVVGLLAAYLGGFLDRATSPAGSFDGRWQVTLTDISGCLDNTPRSFPIVVIDGKTDMSGQKRPKTGEILETGEFSIRATDRAGNLMGKQVGIVVGDRGEGTFQGRKPGCTGKISIARVD